ncbi:MAG TPA: hypothetical protein K8V51_07410, partial [Campylobacter avium]|nr:hypothetical protein [Campylobacter avium]
MNKHLEQLVELSVVDKELDGFTPKIDKINKALRDSELEIQKLEKDLLACEKDILDIKNEQEQNNAHIVQFRQRLDEISKKTPNVKTAKEANALQIEEDIVKEQLEVANEEIEKLDKLLLNKEKLKQELLQDKSKEEEELKNIAKDVESKMEDLEKERALVYDKKSKLTTGINQKVLSFYEKIRKWAKNTAVVPVKKQACYGCFM